MDYKRIRKVLAASAQQVQAGCGIVCLPMKCSIISLMLKDYVAVKNMHT